METYIVDLLRIPMTRHAYNELLQLEDDLLELSSVTIMKRMVNAPSFGGMLLIL